MKKEMIGEVPGKVLGMVADLCHKFQHGTITPEEFGLFLKRKNPFAAGDVSVIVADWQAFYKKFFGADAYFFGAGVKIPWKAGFDRLILIAKGLTPNQVFSVCQNSFSCWRSTDDLDEATKNNNDREPTEPYAIWVRNRQEADKELKDLSVNELKKKGIQGITLLERLLLEIKYWDETGNHLDIHSLTLCVGSRHSDGSVPGVCWRDDEFRVGWCSPGPSDPDIRARVAVS